MVTVLRPPQQPGPTVEELAELFLDTESFYESDDDRLYAMPLNPRVKASELDDALFWRDMARGFVGIFGDPGSGKTLFLITACLKLYYYFYRPVVMDFWPKDLFIQTVGQNNFCYLDETVLIEQLDRINKLAKDRQLSTDEKARWIVDGKGDIYLHGCTFAISEIDRWMDCRRSTSQINHILSGMIKYVRHSDMGIYGDCVDMMDLDRYRAIPRFSAVVRAIPLGNHWFEYHIKQSRKLTRHGTVFEAGRFKYRLYGPDWYRYYHTRNPIGAAPTLKLKHQEVVDGAE